MIKNAGMGLHRRFAGTHFACGNIRVDCACKGDKKMDGAQDWLRDNSPYRKHGNYKRQFCHTQCCGSPPEPTALQAWQEHPDTGQEGWMALHQCRVCGRWYLFWNGGGKRVDSLLGLSVRQASEIGE